MTEATSQSGQDVAVPAEVYAPYAVEDNDTSAFIGVSPEYMTYADDTGKPLRAQGDPKKEPEVAAEEKFLATATPVLVPSEVSSQQTLGAGSTHETVYTANSGENFSAAQAVTEDSGEPATEDVVKEENPRSTAGAETVTTPTESVDASSSEETKNTVGTPVPPPAATSTPAKSTKADATPAQG